MPEGYLDNSDALFQTKCGNQSNISPANPENGQNGVLRAIKKVTMLFMVICSWKAMSDGYLGHLDRVAGIYHLV